MKKTITGWQCFALLSLFLTGSVLTIGGGGPTGRDVWLVELAAALLAIPLVMVFVSLAQRSDPLGLFEQCLGKVLGKGVCLIYGAMALCSAAVTVSVFLWFVRTTALKTMPILIPALILAVAAAVMARCGASVIARFSEVAFPVAALFVIVSLAAALPDADWGALLPILSTGPDVLAESVVASLAMPFSETFFALMVLAPAVKDGRCRISATLALLCSGVFLAAVFAKNIAVLGFAPGGEYFFPSYTAASLITVGSFFQRLEALISAAFVMCELTKCAFCLIFVKQVCSRLLPRAGRGVMPGLAVAVVVLSLVPGGIAPLLNFLRYYPYVLAVFLIALPPLWLVAVKASDRRREKKKG